jgi:3-methyladenine DNA glycosylase AlkD
VIEALRAHADADRAAWDRAYLKLPELTYLGIGGPALHALVRAQVVPDAPSLWRFVDEAWATGVWDARAVAVALMQRKRRLLGPGDLPRLEALLRDAHTWAVVDTVVVHAVGDVLRRHPEVVGVLDRWAADGDFWLRRSALLALLGPLRKDGRADEQRLLRWASNFAGEPEFFLRKAAGWALRELGRRRPDLVDRWLVERLPTLVATTFREAVKPLPPERRAALEREWRSARGRVNRAG